MLEKHYKPGLLEKNFINVGKNRADSPPTRIIEGALHYNDASSQCNWKSTYGAWSNIFPPRYFNQIS
ncbi:MAG: hypothetical protein CM15mP62_23760 [Rhodospirillaceae bacterium]|nr:MAG: hypothetical protein CM15mP62_23760 [Rhodospirillaceae bacterium]